MWFPEGSSACQGPFSVFVEVDREGGSERVVCCGGYAAVDWVGVLLGVRTEEGELQCVCLHNSISVKNCISAAKGSLLTVQYEILSPIVLLSVTFALTSVSCVSFLHTLVRGSCHVTKQCLNTCETIHL